MSIQLLICLHIGMFFNICQENKTDDREYITLYKDFLTESKDLFAVGRDNTKVSFKDEWYFLLSIIDKTTIQCVRYDYPKLPL